MSSPNQLLPYPSSINHLSEISEAVYAALDISKQDGKSTLPFLMEECGELAKAIRNNYWPNIEEELSDILIILGHIANIYDVDLTSAVRSKAAERIARYIKDGR